jgi:hypothetical protein
MVTKNNFSNSILHRRVSAIAAGCSLLLLITGSSLLRADNDDYSIGEHVEPAFEGWRENSDGSLVFMFGYMNENWLEELDVPVGEENFFSPGEFDRGQPTHFQPRRNRFTFEVVVPADWGDRELVWTLTSNGKTRKAYAKKLVDYVVDNVLIASETGSLGGGVSSPESRSNTAPVAVVQGDTVSGEHRRNVRVGEALTLVTHVSDDGLPKPRVETRFANRQALFLRMLNPPARITVNKFNGLFSAWTVYRGEGRVNFDPPQVKLWEDTRPSGNSPWSALWAPPPIPEDGNYRTTVTFDDPGTYVLWGRTDDGGLYADNYVTVNVSP